jgi:hypothetical protein
MALILTSDWGGEVTAGTSTFDISARGMTMETGGQF